MKNHVLKFSCFILVNFLFHSSNLIASDMMEQERNDPVSVAQNIIPGVGETVVHAVIGVVSGTAIEDYDLYRVYGTEGDVVTVDIDGGMGGQRDVDTTIAVFTDGPNYQMLRMNDDANRVDAGSEHRYDSMIENFVLPYTGVYYIGVSHYPRHFTNGAVVTRTFSSSSLRVNGDYNVVVSGITSPVRHINIAIKPGNDKVSPLNPRARGVVPVAILSSDDFDAMDVDVSSLTFGHSGEEVSLHKCNNSAHDANHDGKKDLLCHFDNEMAHWVKGDVEGVLKGQLKDGTMIEGRGLLKVVPEKAN